MVPRSIDGITWAAYGTAGEGIRTSPATPREVDGYWPPSRVLDFASLPDGLGGGGVLGAEGDVGHLALFGADEAEHRRVGRSSRRSPRGPGSPASLALLT